MIGRDSLSKRFSWFDPWVCHFVASLIFFLPFLNGERPLTVTVSQNVPFRIWDNNDFSFLFNSNTILTSFVTVTLLALHRTLRDQRFIHFFFFFIRFRGKHFSTNRRTMLTAKTRKNERPTITVYSFHNNTLRTSRTSITLDFFTRRWRKTSIYRKTGEHDRSEYGEGGIGGLGGDGRDGKIYLSRSISIGVTRCTRVFMSLSLLLCFSVCFV